MPPYVFAEVNEAKARARAAGEDIMDLGMGNPDSGTPPRYASLGSVGFSKLLLARAKEVTG